MIELELMLSDLQKLYTKEKSIKNRVLLEKVITSLKEYEKSILVKREETLTST